MALAPIPPGSLRLARVVQPPVSDATSTSGGRVRRTLVFNPQTRSIALPATENGAWGLPEVALPFSTLPSYPDLTQSFTQNGVTFPPLVSVTETQGTTGISIVSVYLAPAADVANLFQTSGGLGAVIPSGSLISQPLFGQTTTPLITGTRTDAAGLVLTVLQPFTVANGTVAFVPGQTLTPSFAPYFLVTEQRFQTTFSLLALDNFSLAPSPKEPMIPYRAGQILPYPLPGATLEVSDPAVEHPNPYIQALLLQGHYGPSAEANQVQVNVLETVTVAAL
jgi:hypothetical protein